MRDSGSVLNDLLGLMKSRWFTLGIGGVDEKTVREFCEKLDLLTHRERVKQMVLLGRLSTKLTTNIQSVNGPKVSIDQTTAERIKQVGQALVKGDFQARHMAVWLAVGACDGAYLLDRAFSDQSQLLRQLAMSNLLKVVTDDQLNEAVKHTALRERLKLLKRLRRHSRLAAIDKFLEESVLSSPELHSQFLPLGSKDFVESRIHDVLGNADLQFWELLARYNPLTALNLQIAANRQADCFNPRLLQQANTVLRIASKSQPDSAVQLFRELIRFAPPHSCYTHVIEEIRTEAYAEILIGSGQPLSSGISPYLYKCSDATIMEVLKRVSAHPLSDLRWFEKLEPSQRMTLFRAFGDSWRNSSGCISVPMLAYLDAATRKEEAAKYFRAERLSSNLSALLPYATFLGWDECSQVLKGYLSDPDPAIRALAISPMVLSIQFDKGFESALLEFLKSKLNEPDPVRLSSLQALSLLSPSRWSKEHLPALEETISAALKAKDISQSSVYCISNLLVSMVPFHTTWSGTWLNKLMKGWLASTMHQLPSRLNAKLVRELASHIVPALQSYATLEREGHILSFARMLGCRVADVTSLLDVLENLARKSANSNYSVQSLTILSQYARKRFCDLVPTLLNEDPSWSTRGIVIDYLHENRQDLLTPYLGQQAYKGKHSTGSTRIVPNFIKGFFRWNRNQRQIFGKELASLVGGKNQSIWEKHFALARIALLPDGPFEIVIAASALGTDANVEVLRDQAIQCLAKSDTGEGVPELTRCLQDARARVAVYALREAVLSMPPAAALKLLLEIPTEKVTVRKETIRLIGELQTDEAFNELERIEEQVLHRDVRIALHRAFWDYLDRAAVWEIFDKYKSTEEVPIALHLARIPADRLTENGQDKLISLLADLLRIDNSRTKLAILQRFVEMPVFDRNATLCPGIVTELTSSIEPRHAPAAQALLRTYGTREPALIGDAVGKFYENRRALSTFVRMLTLSAGRTGAVDLNLLPAARTTLSALEKDRMSAGLQCSVAGAFLPADEFVDFVQGLEKRGLLHSGSLGAACSALIYSAGRVDAECLEEIESSLVVSESELLRRLALAALVGFAGGNRGWTAERLARLQNFRSDSSPMVAEAAQFTLPESEDILTQVS